MILGSHRASLIQKSINCCIVVGVSGGLIDTKALLSLLHKSDQQTPSLPSLYLDSRLAPESTATAAVPLPVQGLLSAFISNLAHELMFLPQLFVSRITDESS